MSSTTQMTRELALSTIVDAFKKGCDFTTLEIIAGGVLDKFAEYQWSLPSQDGETSDDSGSITAESVNNTNVKKAKKPRAPPTPLDLAAFRAKFTTEPSSLKKSELVKAFSKNGFNIAHLCPDVPAQADGKKKGNKVMCQTSEGLRDILTRYFAETPASDLLVDYSSSDDEEPTVQEVPLTQTGTHIRFEDV